LSLRRTAAAGCLVAALSFGVAACGGDDEGGSTSGEGGGSVNIYSSLPLQGASKAQTGAMVQGIKLAMKQAENKAGDTEVTYESLDDSTAQAGNWDPAQVAANARKVAQDQDAVAYIGEFNSGASAISIPILNQAGIGQLSPANTYPGLTVSEPGTEKGEPEKYYPTGKRTYARIVPRDKIQAAALLTQMQEDGCTSVAIANDKETYGAGLARIVVLNAKDAGVQVQNDGIQKDAANYRSYADGLKAAGVDCFLFSGVTANGAVQIFKDVGAALPDAKLYGPDGVCESGFTNPDQKGIPASLAPRFKCTVATLEIKSTPGGTEFLKAFQDEYNISNPDPYAIYGYEAAQLVLDTIEAGGTTKEAFIEKMFETKDRESVLGTYSIDENGDTTLTDYGLYVVGPDGNPQFEKAIKQSS
jgi:branched-chain amino acid transport system substrate-binding protein